MSSTSKTVTRGALRSFLGRLESIPGVRVRRDFASMGTTRGEEAKLAAIYPQDLARTMGRVAGARFKWETETEAPGRPDPLRGWLAIPTAATMLKFGFDHWEKRRSDTSFAPGLRFTVVDNHNDQTMAWLVVDAEGGTSIRVAPAGEERDARVVANTLDEYLLRALEAGCLQYWHDPGYDPGALEAYRKLEVQRPVHVEIVASDPMDEAQAKRWVKELLPTLDAAIAKDLKARAKVLPELASEGLQLVRLTIVDAATPAFVGACAVGALAEASGAARLLEECGPSDPRFDPLWGRPDQDAPMPSSILGLRHWAAVTTSERTKREVEIVLARSLVPDGAVAGATYSAVARVS